MKYTMVTTLTVLVFGVSLASAGTMWLTPTGGFNLNRGGDGIVVDATTIYVTDSHRSEMDTYDLSGNFLSTIPLTGVSTYLGGYTGSSMKDGDELYLTAMYDGGRGSAVYTFTKTGTFVNQANLVPAVQNTTCIAFDGTYAYLSQNDDPYFAYRVNPDTGAVLQTFASNPGHDQRLGMAYWATGKVLIETYDRGISVLDPADGSELQHLGSNALGHDNQIFGAGIKDNTLYLIVNMMMGNYRVFTYTIEPRTTYLVCPDGSGHFLTIQDAITAARHGDDIELCDATFKGVGNRGLDFLGKTIRLRSQSRNPAACIIDCEQVDRGFSFINGEVPEVLLEGVTIINGLAPGVSPDNVGGAIRCSSGSRPTIVNCVFSGNWGSEGGAVHVASEADPRLVGCVFAGNSAETGGGLGVADVAYARPLNCTFSGNSASVSGGGFYGGEESELDFYNCTFYGNASPLGGGIHSEDGYVYMENCIIAFGTQGAAFNCGGIAEAELYCCDIYGNAGGNWVGCIAGMLGVDGNISEDPLFCDPGYQDFTIRSDSPCARQITPGAA